MLTILPCISKAKKRSSNISTGLSETIIQTSKPLNALIQTLSQHALKSAERMLNYFKYQATRVSR